jgi:hypothetical protein
MYERMLNKQEVPTFDDLIQYSGARGALWLALDTYMTGELRASRQIRFPYGKDYGWGVKYSVKSKHICDVFAENGAFAALFQVSDKAVATIHDELSAYAREIWADKYPCASGGWIEFRVLNEEQLRDLEKILHAKATVRG